MAQAKKPGTGKAGATDASGITDKVREAGEKMRASGERIAGHGSDLGMKLLDQAEQNTSEAVEAMRRDAKASALSEGVHVQGEDMREQGNGRETAARGGGEGRAQIGHHATNRVTG